MAKITRDQVRKINENCKNGFGFDLYHFVMFGEKRLIKEIEIEGNNNKYDVLIQFEAHYERFSKVGVKPVLVVKKLVPTHTEGMYSVHWLKNEQIGEVVKRCSMKSLQEFTKDYSEEKLIAEIKMLIAA